MRNNAFIKEYKALGYNKKIYIKSQFTFFKKFYEKVTELIKNDIERL